MFMVVGEHVFPFLRAMGGEQSTCAHHMRDVRFTIPNASLLSRVVDMIDHVPMEDRDTKGDLYEYMLGTAATRESYFQQIARKAAMSLHDRARAFQSEFQNQQWGPARVIHCWPLLLVEEGLALHTGMNCHPSDGYKLAADWTQNYDSRYGNGLNGPSRGKLSELVRFMFSVEALEDRP